MLTLFLLVILLKQLPYTGLMSEVLGNFYDIAFEAAEALCNRMSVHLALTQ